MIVSRNWLQEYVEMGMDLSELEHRLSMSGLNHEGTESVGADVAIDLEVTSNRPDCLGHLGVAREIAVLWNQDLKIPAVDPAESGADVSDIAQVGIECPDLCYRYTGRVIRGVKVGPSPAWLRDRLEAVGINAVNNIVDITNYVMLECGQPLHAFDLGLLKGPEIRVREAIAGEEFTAIDHRTYKLELGMCVIADAERAVALGGVMGGAETEVSETTTDLLIEAAEFSPISIRNTARKLNLHSPSSYRFERPLDSDGVDWASRRSCQLILEWAGGTLSQGLLDAGRHVPTRQAITLRFNQLKRVLGIEISGEAAHRILVALGCEQAQLRKNELAVVPPSWRHDLVREVDLIEEVARIHGYEQIPEDERVPMVSSHQTDDQRVMNRIRHVLTALGYDEAITTSVVPEDWTGQFDAWTQQPCLKTQTPMLRGANALRDSLVPSLLEARRINQSLGNQDVAFFETAHIYLPRPGKLPREQRTLALVSDGSFEQVKGAVEAILSDMRCTTPLKMEDVGVKILQAPQSCRIQLGDELLGYIGRTNDAANKAFDLRDSVTVAELDIDPIQRAAALVPQHQNQSAFPAITRDVNLIVDEGVRWADLETVVSGSAGPLMEQLRFLEIYRDPKRDGQNKKRLLFTMTFRSGERTLTGQEVDEYRDQVVAACGDQCQAVLLG